MLPSTGPPWPLKIPVRRSSFQIMSQAWPGSLRSVFVLFFSIGGYFFPQGLLGSRTRYDGDSTLFIAGKLSGGGASAVASWWLAAFGWTRNRPVRQVGTSRK